MSWLRWGASAIALGQLGAVLVACELLVGIEDSPPLAGGSGSVDAGVDEDGRPIGTTCTMCGGNCVDLTRDPSNCGECARVCPAGCASSLCIPTLLAETPGEITMLRATLGAATWLETGSRQRIARCRPPDCSATLLTIAEPGLSVNGLSVTTTFTTFYTAGTRAVFRCLNGAACDSLPTPLPQGEQASDVEAQNNHIVVLTRGNVYAIDGNSAPIPYFAASSGTTQWSHVAYVSKTDTTVWTAASAADPSVVTACAGARCAIYTGDADHVPSGLLATTSGVFFTAPARGEVYRCPPTGTCTGALVTGLVRPAELATDGMYVYVSDAVAGTVSRFLADVPRGTPPVVDVVVVGQPGVGPVAVDDKWVYFATRASLGAAGASKLMAIAKR